MVQKNVFMSRLKSIILNSRTKLIFQIFLALIPIALAIYFIKHQGSELSQSLNLIASCNIPWLLAGIAVSACYILILGKMYSSALLTIQARVTYSSAFLLIYTCESNSILSVSFSLMTVKGIQKIGYLVLLKDGSQLSFNTTQKLRIAKIL